jgi:DNA polymerase-1
MAHLSRDKGLLTAFAEGKDIHRATAAEVFGLPLDSVSSEQRRSAKAINFGLIYGMSAFGLARQLNIPRKEAQKYMDLYFERYPGVLEYMERTRAQAKEQGMLKRWMAVVSTCRTSNPATARVALAPSVRRSTPRCRGPRRTLSSAR